jgi:hypothetical protein
MAQPNLFPIIPFLLFFLFFANQLYARFMRQVTAGIVGG